MDGQFAGCSLMPLNPQLGGAHVTLDIAAAQGSLFGT